MNQVVFSSGIFHLNKDGKGSYVLIAHSHDIVDVYPGQENFALDGDEVTYEDYSKNKSDEKFVAIKQITKRSVTNLVGRVEQYKNKYYLVVDNLKFSHYPALIDGQQLNFTASEIYAASIINYPSVDKPYFEVKLGLALGRVGEDSVFINRALIEANVELEFSKETLEQVAKIPDTVLAKELTNRRDLRNLPFVTIDGEDAKDFDDAVYCVKNSDGSFDLSVAIADVANYVTHGSPLDLDALTRGTSIYFPLRVVPMLPEKLSNGLCSLNPNVDRLVMICQMHISAGGEILSYTVDNAVIHSHHRLTYNQVQDFIDKRQAIPNDIQDNIAALYGVYRALLTIRAERGAIDFETEEPYFEFDAAANVTGLKARQRKEAHKLIEECMLAANVSVAKFLTQHNHPTLYRNHDRPNLKKFTALKNYLDSVAVKFDVTQESVTPKNYEQLILQIHDLPNFVIIQQTILRSMQLAEYAPKNIGHFGLAYDSYLHFTSPIRRYPDLLVHRACKAVLENKTYTYLNSINDMGEQTSFCERRAEDLERKVDAYYKCKFAKQHVGDSFAGIIMSIVNFGVFVYLPELMVDGLIHITELGDDYFVFDEKHHQLVGKSSGFKYVMGQELMVTIERVDMNKLFIDLTIIPELGDRIDKPKRRR